jgi:hypothetical protein
MSVVLILALTLPGIGVLATVAVPSRRAGTVLAAIDGSAALAWAAVAIGSGASVGRFNAPPMVAAAAAGAGLVGAAVLQRRRIEQVLPVGLAVGALAAGLTLGLVEGRSGVLFVTMAFVAALALAAERGRDLLVVGAAALVGLAWLAVGLVVLHGKTDSWTLPGALAPQAPAAGAVGMSTFTAAALLLGCAVLAAGGAARGRPVDALLLIGATAVAVRIAGAFTGPNAPSAVTHDGMVPVLALGLGVAAVATALTASPPVPVALLAIAALAGPTADVGAAVLLAAAAVLCVLSTSPVAVAAAVPGAVALAATLRAEPGVVAVGLAVAIAAAGGLVAWRLRLSLASAAPRHPLAPGARAASALAVWLLVAPRAWAWTAPGLLATYQRGALIGLAGALIVLLVGAGRSWLTGGGTHERRPATPAA